MGRRATILFLAANSSDTTPLALDLEAREINERLRASELREAFRIEQAWAVRPSDLQAHLLRYKPTILHFSGHGDPSGELLFNNPLGSAVSVDPTLLAELFRIFGQHVRCVVLNACYSEPQAKAIVEYVDCVVGMAAKAEDDAAISFAGAFYQALGYGQDVQTAFELGCNQIGLTGHSGCTAPKLHVRAGVDAGAIRLAAIGPASSMRMPVRSIGSALYQLRPPPADFTGREEELQDIQAKIVEGGITIAGLTGQGGVGKTALALTLAQKLRASYPDAQIDIDLEGTSDKPLRPAAVMSLVIHAFEPEARLPDSEAGFAARYRSVLHGRRVLLFFDNARDRSQIEPLLPPPGSLLLVTSRQHFTLPGLYLHRLRTLSEAASVTLVRGIAARLDEPTASELAKLCGYLPLALRTAAGTLAEYMALKPALYLERLRGADRAHLVEAALASSLELLDDRVRAFWLRLGVMPADFDADAAAAIGGLEGDDVELRLAEIVRRSLLDWDDSADRYRLHDLARHYARMKLDTSECHATERRHALYYLRVASQAYRLCGKPGATLVEGLRALDREWRHIVAAQTWAAAHVDDDKAAAVICFVLPLVIADLLAFRQHPREHINSLKTALSIALRLDERVPAGRILGHLGSAYADIGELGRALELCEQSLRVAVQFDDLRGQSVALGRLGSVHGLVGQIGEAIELLRKSVRIAGELGDRRTEGMALRGLGSAYYQRGEASMAIKLHRRHLDLAREIGDRQGEGLALLDLGLGYQRAGRLDEGLELFRQGLAVAHEIGDRSAECSALMHLAAAHVHRGHARNAVSLLEQSLAIARELGNRKSEGAIWGSLGVAFAALGDARRAITYYEQHIVLADEIRDRAGSAVTSWNLGEAYMRLGDTRRALQYMQLRIDFYRAIGHADLAQHEAYIAALRARAEA